MEEVSVTHEAIHLISFATTDVQCRIERTSTSATALYYAPYTASAVMTDALLVPPPLLFPHLF